MQWRGLFSLIVGAIFFNSSAFATFLPPNDLYLQDGMFSGGITERDFHTIIDQAEKAYTAVVATHGKTLRFNRRWSDATVNASASQSGSNWNVNMFGGLARRPEVTADGFAMVVCHELGHHLGGFPRTSTWAANEGQSDYFAALACARKLWENETAKNATFEKIVAEYPKSLCDEIYSTSDRQNLCYRQMVANLSIAGLLGALKGDKVRYETPDKSVVSKTSHPHPKAQCRLDTYKEGSLCIADWDENVIPRTEAQSAYYTCTRAGGFTVGTRPHCWFKEAGY